jgi:hypothetical protein
LQNVVWSFLSLRRPQKNQRAFGDPLGRRFLHSPCSFFKPKSELD